MDKPKTVRIVIADDHAIVRMGLRALFEPERDLDVVGEADDGNGAVEACQRLKPDVVIMDILMPGMNGIEATRAIRKASPGTKVLILTTSGVSDDLNAALSAGASGALLKSTANVQLVHAIVTFYDGDVTCTSELGKGTTFAVRLPVISAETVRPA